MKDLFDQRGERMFNLKTKLNELYNKLKMNNGKKSGIKMGSKLKFKTDNQITLESMVGKIAANMILNDAISYAMNGEVALANEWLKDASFVYYSYGNEGYISLKMIVNDFYDEALKIALTKYGTNILRAKAEGYNMNSIKKSVDELNKLDYTLALKYLETIPRIPKEANEMLVEYTKRIYESVENNEYKNEIIAKKFIENFSKYAKTKKDSIIDRIVNDTIRVSGKDLSVASEILESGYLMYEDNNSDDINKVIQFSLNLNDMYETINHKNESMKSVGAKYLEAIANTYAFDSVLRLSMKLDEYANEVYHEIVEMKDLNKDLIFAYLNNLPKIEETIVNKEALINILKGFKDEEYTIEMFKKILEPDDNLMKAFPHIYRDRYKEKEYKTESLDEKMSDKTQK